MRHMEVKMVLTIVIMKCYSAHFIKQLVLHKVSQRMHEVSQSKK